MNKKVILPYYDLEDDIAEESLNIKDLGNSTFQIKNIPFFAPNISYDDIISVEEDDGLLYFDDLILTSENSTVQIVVFDINYIPNILKSIEDLNCSWEGMNNQTILAVDIPSSINYYYLVKSYLDERLNEKIFDYKEACISNTHLNMLT